MGSRRGGGGEGRSGRGERIGKGEGEIDFDKCPGATSC